MEPRRSKPRRTHAAVVQGVVLQILLSLALCGAAEEACKCRKSNAPAGPPPPPGRESSTSYDAISCRAYTASIEEYGGVGDGAKLNTAAFQNAVNNLSRRAGKAGAMLYVPAGKWLTGSFNLTSHFTLFLHKDAVLLASQDIKTWPTIAALPSYGQGRDTKATARYISLIFGANLTDVVITGNNGTIDGQGALWWKSFKGKKLEYTRPYLIELMYSQNIQISDLTLLNSPTWNVHPVYSSNILVQGITILAPVKSPNTDGINPDSCSNVRISDNYIVSGDDCVAIKSGWDNYGMAVGIPSSKLWIQGLTCISPTSAVIALGSEMSGGIDNVFAEDIEAIDSESGVRIKTALGRGGHVTDIYVRRFNMHTMKMAFWMTGDYKSHPDKGANTTAIPEIRNINYRDVVAENVTMAARLEGIPDDPFTDICIANVTIGPAKKAKKQQWTCSDITGISSGATPTPCSLLPDQGPGKIKSCDFSGNYPPFTPMKLRKCPLKIKIPVM